MRISSTFATSVGVGNGTKREAELGVHPPPCTCPPARLASFAGPHPRLTPPGRSVVGHARAEAGRRWGRSSTRFDVPKGPAVSDRSQLP